MRLALIGVAIGLALSVFGQKMVPYSSDYAFKDGIYLTFEDFKNNDPIPITHVISSEDIRSDGFLMKVTSQDSVIFFDLEFQETTISSNDIWGYCQQGIPFIGHDEVEGTKHNHYVFYRISDIGEILLYSGEQTVHMGLLNSPVIGIYRTEDCTKESIERRKTFMAVDYFSGEVLHLSDDILSLGTQNFSN